MQVAFDYLDGPVLGHKQRCEILRRALFERGHEIVACNPYDWLIYDYPTAPDTIAMGYKRLIMGQYPQGINDYAWYPLGNATPKTMVGTQYIIVDPLIEQLCTSIKQQRVLIACGGADPFHLTERLINELDWSSNVSLIIGPNFGRVIHTPTTWQAYYNLSHHALLSLMAKHTTIVCAWGNTTFEALALGAKVLPILTQPEHHDEAQRLGIPYLARQDNFDDIELRIMDLTYNDYGIDTQGVYRVIDFMESL